MVNNYKTHTNKGFCSSHFMVVKLIPTWTIPLPKVEYVHLCVPCVSTYAMGERMLNWIVRGKKDFIFMLPVENVIVLFCYSLTSSLI